MEKLNLIAWMIFFIIACSELVLDCASKATVEHHQQELQPREPLAQNDEHPPSASETIIEDSKNGVEEKTRVTTGFKVHKDIVQNIRRGRGTSGGGAGPELISRKPRHGKSAAASSSVHLSELLGLVMVGLAAVILFF